MKLSIADIPADEVRAAPKVRVENGVGAGIMRTDPAWLKQRLKRMAQERAEACKPRRLAGPIKRKGERPEAVIRSMAVAWALPEHLLRSRDQSYIQEAVVATVIALRKRCPQLSRGEIAHMLGYEDPTSVSRLLTGKASKEWEGS